MLRAVLSPRTEAVREQIGIAPHHPDSLRRPSPRLGAVEDDRVNLTLLWNVFRTFELLPPAFWLRRLQARLHMDPVPQAPHTVRVDLWRALAMPLAHHVEGVRPDVVADVLIETEYAVWTLMLCRDDLRHIETESTNGDFASQLIDATSWYAGTRVVTLGSYRVNTVTRMLAWRWSTGTTARETARGFDRTRAATRSRTSTASGQSFTLSLDFQIEMPPCAG